MKVNIIGFGIVLLGSSVLAETRPYDSRYPTPPKGDTRTLDQLYQLALAEGGKVIVYAGGDAPGQQDATKAAFENRFPGMTLDSIVDLSKYHSPRIDYQLAAGSLVPDLTQLQTLQDFPKWRNQGHLLDYRPIGWDQVYDELKSGGFYYAVTIYVFSNFINTNLLPNPADWPVEVRDYLRPEFKSKIVATYPNDDDAVLYWLKEVVDKYGWQYVRELQAQNVTWVRGSQRAADLVTAGLFPVSFATEGPLVPDGSPTTFVLPKNDPFMFWPQTAGIFREAKHPNGAKLYMSWLLEAQHQASGYTWPVRKDVPPPPGYENPFVYKQTDILGFGGFMADREAVETFRNQVALFLGEVEGPSPTWSVQLGTNPIVPLPH